MATHKITATTLNNENEAKIAESNPNVVVSTDRKTAYNLTPTGRVTLVGTRSCVKCGRAEQTKKNGEHNSRYTLCKGVCVYCYNEAREKKTVSAETLSTEQIQAHIAYLTDMLNKKTQSTEIEPTDNERLITATY